MGVDDVPLDDKAKRMRDLLSSFYAPDPSMSSSNNSSTSKSTSLDAINTNSFDADQYMNLLVRWCHFIIPIKLKLVPLSFLQRFIRFQLAKVFSDKSLILKCQKNLLIDNSFTLGCTPFSTINGLLLEPKKRALLRLEFQIPDLICLLEISLIESGVVDW